MTLDLINGGGYSPTFGELVAALGQSHVLAPYMAVYDDPDDDLPSRIYFYDSNGPLIDVAFMEISRVGNETHFLFNSLNPLMTSPYIYGTDEGWVLGRLTVEKALSDPTLLLP